MAIKKYTNPNKYLMKGIVNLNVSEIMRNAGTKKAIYWDTSLNKYHKRAVCLIEQLYGYSDVKLFSTRGYVTFEQNKKDKGVSNSRHLYKDGKSAHDHYYTGIKKGKRVDIPNEIVGGCYQIADCLGIELIRGGRAVHIDNRKTKWFAKQRLVNGSYKYDTYSTFFNKSNPRPKIKYKKKKYEVYGYRVIGNKFRVKINGKLKWVKVAK